jgi:hypothetical protein
VIDSHEHADYAAVNPEQQRAAPLGHDSKVAVTTGPGEGSRQVRDTTALANRSIPRH